MDYEVFKIKSYSLWDLYLHKEQYPYIGRCYAAVKRAGAENILYILPEETNELFGKIIPAWFSTVKSLYHADWPNVAILGNDWRHLHAHFIPRYFEPKHFHGIDFVDPQPNKNYAPYHKKDLPEEVLMQIRDELRDNWLG